MPCHSRAPMRECFFVIMSTFFSDARRIAAGVVFLTCAAVTPTKAADKVMVSVPPLHSLVSILLDGVDTPGLMIPDAAGLTAKPDADLVDAADLIVWTGPTYETGLASVRAADPAVSLKGLTVTMTVPLLSFAHPNIQDRSTGVQDMRFWLDPRLAKVAVSRIAPNLTRVYPTQSDRILENEVALKKRLKQVEMHIRHALESVNGVPLHVPDSDILYLAWRFNLTVPRCAGAAAKAEGFSRRPGPGLYYEMMNDLLAELKRCQALDRKTAETS